jgi:hypothetical protein
MDTKSFRIWDGHSFQASLQNRKTESASTERVFLKYDLSIIL